MHIVGSKVSVTQLWLVYFIGFFFVELWRAQQHVEVILLNTSASAFFVAGVQFFILRVLEQC